MICTIGSLVQGNANRRPWLLATSLYIFSCSTTALLLGALLSLGGQNIQALACSASLCGLPMALLGIVALAYALSDLELIKLPRPRLMHAVPVTWWRWWRPYGAAVAYGAALGIGVTTEIHFGAFYVLCLWCVVKGNILNGALLMGTYGAVRALTIVPASYIIYKGESHRGFWCLLGWLPPAKLVMAAVLIVFGVYTIGSLW